MDLDKAAFDIECPQCGFFVRFRYRDARLRDVLICRGCKTNIRLDDNMNECRKARRRVQQMMRKLQRSLGSLNITIKL